MGPCRVIPSVQAPITFYLRDSSTWLELALADQCVEDHRLSQALTGDALRAWELLKKKGACFVEDVQQVLGFNRQQTVNALWELAAAGLAAADGFDQLRAMIDPARRTAATTSYRKVRSAAGRWSLFSAQMHAPADRLEQARHTDTAVESAARMLLARYGVLFRDLIVRESNIPSWGVLLRMLRRFEDRGEVRGGRFVSGFSGEQFALPDVIESLRAGASRNAEDGVEIAGADPLNLVGILIPGERVSAIPGRSFVFNHQLVSDEAFVDCVRNGRSSRSAPKKAPIPKPEILQNPISQLLF
jgi:ATP-dependent Lhr-like helicase